jgi:tetratricopeptide (TPR) repeat protein
MADQDNILNLLERGYALHQIGYLEQAEGRYQEVLIKDRKNIHALNLMGMLCVNSLRPDEAVIYLTLALKQSPNNPETHANIALAFKDQGNFDKAIHHFRQSLQLNPDNPVVRNNLGNVFRETGRPRDAIKTYERALKLDPSFAECWSNLAAALNEAEQRDAALRAVEHALRLEPDMAQAHNNKGDILLARARYEGALACYRKATDLNPKYVAAMINMAKTQRDSDDPDGALETLTRVLKIEPSNPEAHHAMGVLLEQMGKPERAADSFKAAINVAPGMSIAHYYLAQLKGRDCSDDELEAMLKLWERETMLPNDRMFLAFGIARAHEQRNDYDTAFQFLDQGNRIKAQQQPYDDTETKKFVDGLVTNAESTAERLGFESGWDDSRPVFILGMPRSGTSLTEQILASHSEVAGAGELSYAYDTAHRIREITGQSFPGNMQSLNATQLAELGRYYMSRHRDENLAHRYVVDKTPLNFQYIGLLGLALPRARFIHCHRNPVQNCFSIHKIPFDKKQAYAHSLEALGMYYNLYWRMMQRWKTLFPGRILDVRYEDTVADTERQGRRILQFLELPFENTILDFYKTRRLVKTPSASQVRQPIYADALESWRKYEKHMGPLLQALDKNLLNHPVKHP